MIDKLVKDLHARDIPKGFGPPIYAGDEPLLAPHVDAAAVLHAAQCEPRLEHLDPYTVVLCSELEKLGGKRTPESSSW